MDLPFSKKFRQRHPQLTRGLAVGATFATAFVVGLAYSSWALVCRAGACPAVDVLDQYQPRQTSKLYAADGRFIAELGLERRTLLKIEQIPPLVRNACCNSGSGANIRKADLKAEDKTDRPGFDINNFTVRGWQECERACAGESQCGGWSYARAGVQGPQGRCWIKSRAPNPVVNPGIVSGVKWKPRSVRFD